MPVAAGTGGTRLPLCQLPRSPQVKPLLPGAEETGQAARAAPATSPGSAPAASPRCPPGTAAVVAPGTELDTGNAGWGTAAVTPRVLRQPRPGSEPEPAPALNSHLPCRARSAAFAPHHAHVWQREHFINPIGHRATAPSAAVLEGRRQKALGSCVRFRNANAEAARRHKACSSPSPSTVHRACRGRGQSKGSACLPLPLSAAGQGFAAVWAEETKSQSPCVYRNPPVSCRSPGGEMPTSMLAVAASFSSISGSVAKEHALLCAEHAGGSAYESGTIVIIIIINLFLCFPIKPSLSQPRVLLFPRPSAGGRMPSGCVALRCWLRLNHDSIPVCSEASRDEASRYHPTAEPRQNQCPLGAEQPPLHMPHGLDRTLASTFQTPEQLGLEGD